MTRFEKFHEWLDGPLLVGEATETRREFAKRIGASIHDLRWAFEAGYTYGELEAYYEIQKEWKEVFKNE